MGLLPASCFPSNTSSKKECSSRGRNQLFLPVLKCCWSLPTIGGGERFRARMKGGAVLGQWLGGRSVGQLLDFLMLLKWTFMVGLGSNVYIAGLPVRGCFSPWLVYPLSLIHI